MMYRLVLMTAMIALTGVAALAQHQAAPGTIEPAPQPADLLRANGGSLLRASLAAKSDPNQAKLTHVSFTAVPEPEPRTLKKHDLVTIIIRQESQFSSEGTADTSKEANIDAALDEWVKFSLKNWALQGGAQGENPPSVKMGFSRDFKGEATVDRKDKFIARVTAEVVDVKPNGTLVLQAKSKITTDEEIQELLLTGVCRVDDISIDNTVLSTQMYDLVLTKKHSGAVHDSTKRGIFSKLLDILNPF